MKMPVPLRPDALARVDQLDKEIAAIEQQLAGGVPWKAHQELRRSIKAKRYRLDEECAEAMLRVHKVAPTRGLKGRRIYHVARHPDGSVTVFLNTGAGP